MASLAQRAKAALETLSTALVISAASALLWTIFVKQQPAAAPSPSHDVKGVIARQHLANGIGTGPIAIVEFTDFQCPFCAKHAHETLPTLKKTLIDSGQVRYITLNLPLAMHQHAILAAKVAECAGAQRKYWEMHDLLYSRTKWHSLWVASRGSRITLRLFTWTNRRSKSV